MLHERKGSQSDAKLSLVAAFDDLARDARVLKESCELEFKVFVHGQEDCRRKWMVAEQNVDVLQEKVEQLSSENSKLHTRLKHAKTQIDYEMQRRKQVELEKEAVERQIALIREMLNNKNGGNSIMLNEQDRERLAFLSMTQQTSRHESPKKMQAILESSASILSDISYDKTEDDLEASHLRSGRKWKRPSAPPVEDEYDHHNTTPPKRQCLGTGEDPNGSIVTTTTIAVDQHGQPMYAETEVRVPKLNKSFSEPALDKHLLNKPSRDIDSDPESDDSFWGSKTPGNRNKNNKRTPQTPIMRKANSASKGLNRVHVFISKTVIKPESCVPCGKRIRFGKLGMKCKDCRSMCHPECKDKLPLPCFPSCPSTPGTSKTQGGLISDYTSVEPPMLPALIVHCVNELESRGLNEVGIYRVPGSDREVKDLKEKFLRGKGIPNLSHITDIHAICGCIKDFLRHLKEPLVTYALWNDFVHAAERPDLRSKLDGLYDCIDRLPQPNRDTMAFLIIHLLRVSQTPECKMPSSNLSKVFGPTVVGYSCAEPEPMQMINETRRQNMVMEYLLEIPHEYWQRFMDVENSFLYPTECTPGTPTPVKGALRSRLGPILTPGSYEEYQKSRVLTQTQTTPRPLMPPLRRSGIHQQGAPLANISESYL
ncbi:rac GTPase-activating protein 1 isoform X2 [Patella vulgata]|uniref:rac GTPase-activating protein 1 isoform X2 n=1 Tax=Patella vulgata TaxID=6465 RepID=UPI00217F429E|nr:rac GTPase-activating protein 1 isoform X2 [Patella vulgata]